MRALAVLLVVGGHGTNLAPKGDVRYLLLINGGYFGVEIFFVLSGFLVGRILLRLFERDCVSPRDLWTFWVRRWFRTLPNYFLFLALAVLVFPYFFQKFPFDSRYLYFSQNLTGPMPQLMPESWSLAVEEWFYLSAPLLLLLMRLLPVQRRTAFLLGTLLMIGSSTFLRWETVLSDRVVWDRGIRKVVIYRLDVVGMGVLMAYIDRYGRGFLAKHRRRLGLAGALVLVGASYGLSKWALMRPEPLLEKTALLSLSGVGIALTIPWLLSVHVPSARVRAVIQWLSAISYSMYLLHYSVGVAALYDLTWPWPLKQLIYWGIAVGGGTMVYLGFERPMTRLRERFTRTRESLG